MICLKMINGDIVNQRNMNDDRDKENPTHKFLESTIDKSTKLNAITKQVKVSIIDDDQSDEDDNDDSVNERDVKGTVSRKFLLA